MTTGQLCGKIALLINTLKDWILSEEGGSS